MKPDRSKCSTRRLATIACIRSDRPGEARSSVEANLALSRRHFMGPTLPEGKNDELKSLSKLALAKAANRRLGKYKWAELLRPPALIPRVHCLEYLAALAVLS
jgi:hypothetical protein